MEEFLPTGKLSRIPYFGYDTLYDLMIYVFVTLQSICLLIQRFPFLSNDDSIYGYTEYIGIKLLYCIKQHKMNHDLWNSFSLLLFSFPSFLLISLFFFLILLQHHYLHLSIINKILRQFPQLLLLNLTTSSLRNGSRQQRMIPTSKDISRSLMST